MQSSFSNQNPKSNSENLPDAYMISLFRSLVKSSNKKTHQSSNFDVSHENRRQIKPPAFVL